MNVGLLVEDESQPDTFSIEVIRSFPHDMVRVVALRQHLALRSPGEILDSVKSLASECALVFNRLTGDIRQQSDVLGSPLLAGVIGRALGKIDNIFGRPGRYSLSGDRLPLCLQWLSVQEEVPETSVPRFEYAFGARAPKVESFSRPIHKDVFDELRWREDPDYVCQWNAFVVDRPEGEPYAVALIGDNALVHPMGMADTGPTNLRVLSDAARRVARSLNHRVGGCLFFQDGVHLSFASFTPDIGLASACGGFRHWVRSSVLQTLSRRLQEERKH